MAPRPEHRKRPNRKYLMVTLIVEAEDDDGEHNEFRGLEHLKDVGPADLADLLEFDGVSDYDPHFEGSDMAIKFNAIRVLRAYFLPKPKLTKFEKEALARKCR